MTDAAVHATHEGLSFTDYHDRELTRLATMLVAASGGKITVTRQAIESLAGLQLIQTVDHATGEMEFTIESFGEAQ